MICLYIYVHDIYIYDIYICRYIYHIYNITLYMYIYVHSLEMGWRSPLPSISFTAECSSNQRLKSVQALLAESPMYNISTENNCW